MKKLLTTLVFVIMFVATAATLNQRRTLKLESDESKKDEVVISGETLHYDTLQLSLKTIPKAQQLYTVAKKSVGRWAKLFTVIKIEESGADGQNSFYARNYGNLTGMRFPGTGRKTTAIKSGHNYYAIFSNWHDCMVDFSYYMEVMDGKFEAKYGRPAKDEYEMVNFMFGSFNIYGKWKSDVLWLLNHYKYK
jgi:hypothetical protein